MNAGEVENPGAFDSEEKTAKTTPVGEGKNPPEPSQMIDPDEPIGDDGVNYDVYADGPEANGTITANDADLEFSAEDIRNRKKTNFFVNIKDADKLQREAERKQAADSKRILAEQRRAEKETARAEKAAAAERTRQQKYNDELEKNAHKEIVAEEKHLRHLAAVERGHKRDAAFFGAIANFFKSLWRGWHKFITIAVLIALAVFGYFVWRSYNYYYTVVVPKEQKIKQANTKFDLRYEYSKEFISQIQTAYNEGDGDDYNNACKKAEELIKQAEDEKDDAKLFYYTIEYARFILSIMPMSYETVISKLDSVSDMAINDIEKATIYNVYSLAYFEGGDTQKSDWYQKQIEELDVKESEEGNYVKED